MLSMLRDTLSLQKARVRWRDSLKVGARHTIAERHPSFKFQTLKTKASETKGLLRQERAQLTLGSDDKEVPRSKIESELSCLCNEVIGHICEQLANLVLRPIGVEVQGGDF